MDFHHVLFCIRIWLFHNIQNCGDINSFLHDMNISRYGCICRNNPEINMRGGYKKIFHARDSFRTTDLNDRLKRPARRRGNCNNRVLNFGGHKWKINNLPQRSLRTQSYKETHIYWLCKNFFFRKILFPLRTRCPYVAQYLTTWFLSFLRTFELPDSL